MALPRPFIWLSIAAVFASLVLAVMIVRLLALGRDTAFSATTGARRK